MGEGWSITGQRPKPFGPRTWYFFLLRNVDELPYDLEFYEELYKILVIPLSLSSASLIHLLLPHKRPRKALTAVEPTKLLELQADIH